MRRVWAAFIGLIAVVLAAKGAGAEAHPIHTTIAQFRWDARSGSIEGSVRIYADDLADAARVAGLAHDDYVRKNLALSRGTRAIPFSVCGLRRAADAILVCLRATTDEPRGIRVRNTLLFERYADQLNIVRFEHRTATTLLLSRATPERLID